LAEALTDDAQAALVDLRALAPAGRSGTALAADAGRVSFDVRLPGPGVYGFTIGCVVVQPGAVRVQVGEGPDAASATAEVRPGMNRIATPQATLRNSAVKLTLTGDGRLGVTSLIVKPEYRPLPANLWMTLGPFPSEYLSPDTKKAPDLCVKEALDTVRGPERKLKLGKVYASADGKEIGWRHSDATDGAVMKDGVNFAIRCGVKKSQVCCAATFVKLPTKRDAQIRISCDYWASLYVNGKQVRSLRSEENASKDGAQFKGTARMAANIRLREGVNTLLVKVQGGSGGNSITAAVTDPGDLTFSHSRSF